MSLCSTLTNNRSRTWHKSFLRLCVIKLLSLLFVLFPSIHQSCRLLCEPRWWFLCRLLWCLITVYKSGWWKVRLFFSVMIQDHIRIPLYRLLCGRTSPHALTVKTIRHFDGPFFFFKFHHTFDHLETLLHHFCFLLKRDRLGFSPKENIWDVLLITFSDLKGVRHRNHHF